MPCIQLKVSTPVTQKQEITLKERLGQAITIFPGKQKHGLWWK